MMRTEPWYHIDGRHALDTLEIEADPGWLRTDAKALFCDECHETFPTDKAIDICFERPMPPVVTCCMFERKAGFAHREFLGQFGWDLIQRHFYLGRVFDAEGNLQKDYVTFRTKGSILYIRGRSHHSNGEPCEKCGRRGYYPLPPKTRYLTRASLTGAPMYESDLNQLVVNEKLFAKLDQKRWRGLYVEKLPVLDHALDGLPDVIGRYDQPRPT